MAGNRSGQNLDGLFPRLKKLSEGEDVGPEAVAPRLQKLLTEDEIQPEDLQLRGEQSAGEMMAGEQREAPREEPE